MTKKLIPSCNQRTSRSARRGGRKRRLTTCVPTRPKHDNLVQRLQFGITPANIRWENNTPVSEAFGDVYFSKDNGLEESRYVFLQNNSLPERWQSCEEKEFTILETGFGTGLNFIAAWHLWKAQAPENLKLNYISVEKFPLKKEELEKALSLWPLMNDLSGELIKAYPEITAGRHELYFKDDKINLILLFGDVSDVLGEVANKVDCWFLDGFAPSKNPDMWNEGLYNNMARLTKHNGTFATFTAAGFVKRGIQGAGFYVEKVRGFGRKREMLRGYKI